EQPIDFSFRTRIGEEQRGLMWFAACINDSRTPASPVFVFDQALDAVDVRRRIATGKCRPWDDVDSCGDKRRVVADDQQWCFLKGLTVMSALKHQHIAQSMHFCTGFFITYKFVGGHGYDTREDDLGVFKIG